MSLTAIRQMEPFGRLGVVPWTTTDNLEKIEGLEVAARMDVLSGGLRAAGIEVNETIIELTDEANLSELFTLIRAVHEESFLFQAQAPVTEVGVRGVPSELNDTPFVPSRWTAAVSAAQATLEGAQLAEAEQKAVYCLVRPPGHHASGNHAGGYCLLNNTAIATHWMLNNGSSRIAILDLDYHLGNGTLDITENDPRITYLSVHSDNPSDYPYVFPASPLLTGFTTPPSKKEYLTAVDGLIAQIPTDADLIVSLGFDGTKDDPHGTWTLPINTWQQVGRRIGRTGKLRLVVQEGGYNLNTLGKCAQKFAEGVLRGPREAEDA